MQIKYLKHNQIDYFAWDKCISESHNSLIYAYSWYLDVVSPGWEALIAGEYEYVMPLTVKRKYGFKFIVQPPWTQQLGIFSKSEIEEGIIRKFIKKIPYFSYDINLNEKNRIPEAQPMANYVLDLNLNYENIASNYTKKHRREIRVAQKNNVIIKDNISAEVFLHHFLNQKDRKYIIPENDFFIQLISKGTEKNAIINYAAYTSEGELILIVCFFKSEKRIIDSISYSIPICRDLSAKYLLLNEVIKKYSERDYIFDFDGSLIESIAYFNKGFGAKYSPYYKIRKHSIVSLLEKVRKIMR